MFRFFSCNCYMRVSIISARFFSFLNVVFFKIFYDNIKDMELIRKPSPMLPVVILIVVAPPSGHSVMHPVQAGAEHALWQVVFTSSLITTSK